MCWFTTTTTTTESMRIANERVIDIESVRRCRYSGCVRDDAKGENGCARAAFPRAFALAFLTWPGLACACAAAVVTQRNHAHAKASKGEGRMRGSDLETDATHALALMDPKSNACKRVRTLGGVGVILTGATALVQWRVGRAFSGIPHPERIEVGWVIGMFAHALASTACFAVAVLGRGGLCGPTKMQLLRARLDEDQFRQLVSLREDEETGNVSDSGGGSPDVSVARGNLLTNQGVYELAPSLFKRELEGSAASGARGAAENRASERGTASRRAARPISPQEAVAVSVSRDAEYKTRRDEVLQRLHAANRLS